MYRWLLVINLIMPITITAHAAPVEIPPQGRPGEHFYGAAGVDVMVRSHVEPKAITLGEPIELTLTLDTLLNPEDVQRPDLKTLSEFHEAFRVEDVPERAGDITETSRVFRYRLYPRRTDVREIPAFWMRYFNPERRASSTSPARWYAFTGPDDPIPIMVNEPIEPSTTPEPMRIPDFTMEPLPVPESTTRRDDSCQFCRLTMLLAPPVLALVAILIARRLHPDSSQRIRRRRGRAARRALRELARLPRDDPRSLTDAVEIVSAYVHTRFPIEEQPIPSAAQEWFENADRARYGPGTHDALEVISQAERLIEELETLA